MAVVLVREDGSGLGDANAYADVVGSDSYHEGHLYAASWSDADADVKSASLVMATRVIDSLFQFGGYRRSGSQALQWPRRWCPDRDAAGDSIFPNIPGGPFFDEGAVPRVVRDATCELARELIEQDRTEDPDDEGLKSIRIEGAVDVDFNAATRMQIVPVLVQSMLAKVGTYLPATSGSVKLVRC